MHRLNPRLLLALVLIASAAFARGGGGESYSSGRDSDSGGGGGDIGPLIEILVYLIIYKPQIGCPLALFCGVAYFFWQRNNSPTARTQKQFAKAEAEHKTFVDPSVTQTWVAALKAKDPQFSLEAQLGRVRTLFTDLQQAWFKRDMTPVRPFLSDATYQRFVTQLQILQRNNVRDAIADLRILDCALIGYDAGDGFDTIHVRIEAELRDTDVPASYTDDQALTAARRMASDDFIEVWSFVRKPGAKTKIGEDLFQGKCPNCGAPFNGGAANNCEHCGAIVNSGHHDWVLAEITQGNEHERYLTKVEGSADIKRADPAFSLQILEDRASLVFWKWIDAYSTGDVSKLSKLSSNAMREKLKAELDGIKQTGRRRVILEAAAGAANTRIIRRTNDGVDHAHVEIRWSARMGLVPLGQAATANMPTLPQRSVFSFVRKSSAATNEKNGMSTNRCPNCSAPLTDTVSPNCEYCGTLLSDGERDWVLDAAVPYETWQVSDGKVYRAPAAAAAAVPVKHAPADGVVDVQERERLLYMMAAMAAADGMVDDRERNLLQMCSKRWSVPWSNVEMALNAGDRLFDRLVPKGSPEAEVFLKHIVDMALIDGKVDRQERKLLDSAAHHLGVADKLPAMLGK